MASLILSTTTNPGAATWASAASDILAYPDASFTASGTATPTTNAAYCFTTSGSQVNITVSAAAFCGQIITYFFQTDGGQNQARGHRPKNLRCQRAAGVGLVEIYFPARRAQPGQESEAHGGGED